MKTIKTIAVLLLFSQFMYSQFYYEKSQETPFEPSNVFACCNALEERGKLSISAINYSDRIFFNMDFWLDDICLDSRRIVISYEFKGKFNRYILGLTNDNQTIGIYDGLYAFIDYTCAEDSLKGFSVNNIKDTEKFWNDFKQASAMYVKIEGANSCLERILTFNLKGSAKAYNYIKAHPNAISPL
ncbi:MAG: hypothetical protein IKO63_02025 [Paludibacteraceae bacterium]|nr:hypothetical protein [Paludibacteraceae bacterium]